MTRRRFVVVCALVVGLTSSLLAATKGDFAKYDKKSAVLKDTLYTVIYPRPNALGTGDINPTPAYVTILSKEKGVYYAGDFQGVGGIQMDRDVEQLVQKVTANTGRTTFMTGVMNRDASQTDAAKVRGIQLLEFKPGSLVKVKQIKFDGKKDRAVIELYDDLTTKGNASTAITIEGVSVLSKEDVEELVGKYLEFK